MRFEHLVIRLLYQILRVLVEPESKHETGVKDALYDAEKFIIPNIRVKR